jgi:hypothetical protein
MLHKETVASEKACYTLSKLLSEQKNVGWWYTLVYMQMQLLNDMISIYFARSPKKYMNGTFNTYKQVVQ